MPPKPRKGGAAGRGAPRTFDVLVADAERRADELDLDAAALLYEQALELREDDVRVLDALGDVYFQLGDAERAQPLFARSVELDPEGHYAKHMHLGQLLEGADAAAAFVKGVELLERALAGAPDGGAAGAAGGPPAPPPTDGERARLRRALSNACCSLAELYMTDLCDEEGAEAACDAYASRAVATDGGNAEALRVLADLRMCQQRRADAAPLLLRAVELMEALYPADEDEDDDAGGGAEEAESAEVGAEAGAAGSAVPSFLAAALGGSDDPASQLPPYAARLRAAQVALELDLHDAAATLLGRLLAEDDSNMEVWYLLGEAHVLGGDAPAAVDVLRAADAMLDEAIGRKTRSAAAAAKLKKKAKAAGRAGRGDGGGGGGGGGGDEGGGLLAYSRTDLEAQRAQIRKLLAVAEAEAAAEGGSAGGAAAEGGAAASGGAMAVDE